MKNLTLFAIRNCYQLSFTLVFIIWITLFAHSLTKSFDIFSCPKLEFSFLCEWRRNSKVSRLFFVYGYTYTRGLKSTYQLVLSFLWPWHKNMAIFRGHQKDYSRHIFGDFLKRNFKNEKWNNPSGLLDSIDQTYSIIIFFRKGRNAFFYYPLSPYVIEMSKISWPRKSNYERSWLSYKCYLQIDPNYTCTV